MATRTSPAPAVSNGSRPRPAVSAGAGLASGRRSAPMALFGAGAVVAGALLFLVLYSSMNDRRAVLVVARSVPAGQLISAADLAVVRISPSDGVASMAASSAPDVVGKTAAVGLVPGALLAPSQVGAVSTLQADQAVVGLALKAGQAPPSLRPGARVEVVDTVAGTAGEPARPMVLSTTAVVSCAIKDGASTCGTASATSGITVVSLTLPVGEAPVVAAAAADGRLSLVVLPVAPAAS